MKRNDNECVFISPSTRNENSCITSLSCSSVESSENENNITDYSSPVDLPLLKRGRRDDTKLSTTITAADTPSVCHSRKIALHSSNSSNKIRSDEATRLPSSSPTSLDEDFVDETIERPSKFDEALQILPVSPNRFDEVKENLVEPAPTISPMSKDTIVINVTEQRIERMMATTATMRDSTIDQQSSDITPALMSVIKEFTISREELIKIRVKYEKKIGATEEENRTRSPKKPTMEENAMRSQVTCRTKVSSTASHSQTKVLHPSSHQKFKYPSPTARRLNEPSTIPRVITVVKQTAEVETRNETNKSEDKIEIELKSTPSEIAGMRLYEHALKRNARLSSKRLALLSKQRNRCKLSMATRNSKYSSRKTKDPVSPSSVFDRLYVTRKRVGTRQYDVGSPVKKSQRKLKLPDYDKRRRQNLFEAANPHLYVAKSSLVDANSKMIELFSHLYLHEVEARRSVPHDVIEQDRYTMKDYLVGGVYRSVKHLLRIHKNLNKYHISSPSSYNAKYDKLVEKKYNIRETNFKETMVEKSKCCTHNRPVSIKKDSPAVAPSTTVLPVVPISIKRPSVLSPRLYDRLENGVSCMP